MTAGLTPRPLHTDSDPAGATSATAEISRLGLDDTVESRLPGVVPKGDRMTIRQLLNHSSGLYEVHATLPSPRSEEFLKIR